ncbi:hypothetical protein ACFWQL_29385 [Amycolatopsis thermoflava]|uniref:hypothetical protein n=1 Tax=Amycolatopsis thermoflava TaxID=84480 RepID=UPI003653E6F7
MNQQLVLISMSAANALAVYPQLAPALFGREGSAVAGHYAEQFARLFGKKG